MARECVFNQFGVIEPGGGVAVVELNLAGDIVCVCAAFSLTAV